MCSNLTEGVYGIYTVDWTGIREENLNLSFIQVGGFQQSVHSVLKESDFSVWLGRNLSSQAIRDATTAGLLILLPRLILDRQNPIDMQD